MNRFEHQKQPHEVLDIIIDEWCERERGRKKEAGLPLPSKLELKNQLGHAVGLGNGTDDNSAGKGIYRYCSGETDLSIKKALHICHFIENYELIQWMGYQAGLLMTPRRVIENLAELDESDMFEEIVKCLKDTTGFVETMARTYQQTANFGALHLIEEMFMKALLQMEKTRLILKELIERMLKPGTQGTLWFQAGEKKKGRGK